MSSDKPPLTVLQESLPTRVQKKQAILTELQGVLAFVVVFVMLASVLLIQIRQHSDGSLLNDVQNTNRVIVDCTTPGHKCFEDSKKTTSTTIGDLDQIIILAAFCAKQENNATVKQVQACVMRGLK